MAEAADHLTWALQHFRAVAVLETHADGAPWAAVALFYTGLHLAHAVFAEEPGLGAPFRHPENHTSQDHFKPGTLFTMSRHFRAAYDDYRTLYGISRSVRYTGDRVAPATVADLKANELAAIRTWARGKLTATGLALSPTWP